MPGNQRARYLYALAHAVLRHARLFAVLESLDNGKPMRESRDIAVPRVARHFYPHAGWAQLPGSEFSDHEPMGVIGQGIPWSTSRRSERIGLPAGGTSVNGDGATGAALVGHAAAWTRFAFIGSTEVGRTIRSQIAGSGKSLTLELGGKSPFIVLTMPARMPPSPKRPRSINPQAAAK